MKFIIAAVGVFTIYILGFWDWLFGSTTISIPEKITIPNQLAIPNLVFVVTGMIILLWMVVKVIGFLGNLVNTIFSGGVGGK